MSLSITLNDSRTFSLSIGTTAAFSFLITFMGMILACGLFSAETLFSEISTTSVPSLLAGVISVFSESLSNTSPYLPEVSVSDLFSLVTGVISMTLSLTVSDFSVTGSVFSVTVGVGSVGVTDIVSGLSFPSTVPSSLVFHISTILFLDFTNADLILPNAEPAFFFTLSALLSPLPEFEDISTNPSCFSSTELSSDFSEILDLLSGFSSGCNS